jgi:hypothetical protein
MIRRNEHLKAGHSNGTADMIEVGVCMCSDEGCQGGHVRGRESPGMSKRISKSKCPCNAGIDDTLKQAGPLSGV